MERDHACHHAVEGEHCEARRGDEVRTAAGMALCGSGASASGVRGGRTAEQVIRNLRALVLREPDLLEGVVQQSLCLRSASAAAPSSQHHVAVVNQGGAGPGLVGGGGGEGSQCARTKLPSIMIEISIATRNITPYMRRAATLLVDSSRQQAFPGGRHRTRLIKGRSGENTMSPGWRGLLGARGAHLGATARR